jgi:hypothetical protein
MRNPKEGSVSEFPEYLNERADRVQADEKLALETVTVFKTGSRLDSHMTEASGTSCPRTRSPQFYHFAKILFLSGDLYVKNLARTANVRLEIDVP